MSTATIEMPTAEPKGKAATKFSLPLKSLQRAMTAVAPAVERKTTIPILSGVRIEPKDGAAEFLATDLDLSVRATVKLQGAQPGSAFILPALKLDSYAKLLQGEAVSITRSNDSRANLRCGRSNTNLPLLPVASFPAVGLAPETRAVAIQQDVLERMLDRCLIAVSREESRHIINGALLVADRYAVRMVATDGHRLSVYTVRMDAEPFTALLPAKMLGVIAKTLDTGSLAPCSLSVTDTGIFASFGDSSGGIEIGSRKLTGQFPNYEAVLPRENPIAVRVSAAELTAAIRRAVSFTDGGSGAVKLTIEPTCLTLKAASVETGETEETLEVASAESFAPLTVGFNGAYLIDALSQIEGDVALQLKDAQSAMLIRDTPADGETFEYVVMPMRV